MSSQNRVPLLAFLLRDPDLVRNVTRLSDGDLISLHGIIHRWAIQDWQKLPGGWTAENAKQKHDDVAQELEKRSQPHSSPVQPAKTVEDILARTRVQMRFPNMADLI